MVILLFQFLFVVTANAVGFDCEPRSCKHGQPQVRYPFRLQGRQPDHCGYKGFNLSCNNQNRTVLELPTSVKLMVKCIDYVKQWIEVYDEQKCVQNQLQNLNLSASPFLFMADDYYDSRPENFTLFNCSAGDPSDYNSRITCLDGDGFYVKLVDYDSTYADLLNCRKWIDILNVPEGLLSDETNIFRFNWSEPACGPCEAHHKGCRPSSTNVSGIECFDIRKKKKDT